MTGQSAIAGLSGVRTCIVGERDGAVIREWVGASSNGAATISAAARLTDALRAAGARLGLGDVQVVATKSQSAAWLFASDNGAVIAIGADPSRPTAEIEAALRTTNWSSTARAEWVVDDSEIEYVAPEPPPAQSASTAPANEGPSRTNRGDVPVLEEKTVATPVGSATGTQAPDAMLRRGERAEPQRAGPPRPDKRPVASPTSSPRVYASADLRRALLKGQLAQAEIVAATFGEASPLDEAACRGADFAPALRPLLDGIAAILAGDEHDGLRDLDRAKRSAGAGPSLLWAAELWSARATANTGPRLATAHAQESLRLAGELDFEAQGASTYILADLAFHRSDLAGALALNISASDLLAKAHDDEEQASCLLLQARILEAMGRHQEGVLVAGEAHRRWRSWPPPVAFLARDALRAGLPEQAEQALNELAEVTPVPPEIGRARRILDHVRAGILTPQVANEYLRLTDAPATRETIRLLEGMARRFPHLSEIEDTLAWSLLRAGYHEAAGKVFERLGAKPGMPEDLRASIQLGLGCLATFQSRAERTGTKPKTAGDAAPSPLAVSSRPKPLRPSGSMPKAEPVEPRSRVAPETPIPGPMPAARPSVRPGFSGKLQIFGLPDLLEILRSGRRTGTLVCSSAAGTGAIRVREGRIAGGASPGTKALSHYLAARGSMTAQAFEAATQAMHEGPPPRPSLGIALVKGGHVAATQMRQAVVDQLRDTIRELITWGEGHFAFDPESAEPWPFEVEFDVDSQTILLEIFTEQDEASVASTDGDSP